MLKEGTPKNFDISKFQTKIQEIKEVKQIHDLHVWTINAQKPALTAHIDIDPSADNEQVLKKVTTICR